MDKKYNSHEMNREYIVSNDQYVVNFAHDIVYVSDETIVVKAFGDIFTIKGTMMATAVKEILDTFQESKTLEDVVEMFSNKYSSDSLKKILNFLIHKTVLIKKEEALEVLRHNATYLEKVYPYTLGGKSLLEIQQTLKPLNICLIGTSQLVRSLLLNLVDGGLLTHFKIVITDDGFEIPPDLMDSNAIDVFKGLDFLYIQEYVAKSDYVIVGVNHHNHYLFNQINEICLKENKKWLRIVVDYIRVEIGPLFVPYETCCYTCFHAKSRQFMRVEEYALDNLYIDPNCDDNTKKCATKFASIYPLNPLSASIASLELTKHIVGMKCNLVNQLIEIDCLDYQLQKHYIFKNYSCPTCVGGTINE